MGIRRSPVCQCPPPCWLSLAVNHWPPHPIRCVTHILGRALIHSMILVCLVAVEPELCVCVCVWVCVCVCVCVLCVCVCWGRWGGSFAPWCSWFCLCRGRWYVLLAPGA